MVTELDPFVSSNDIHIRTVFVIWIAFREAHLTNWAK